MKIDSSFFDGARVYSTSEVGKAFLDSAEFTGKVEVRHVLESAYSYSEEERTIYIGKFQLERNGFIELSDAVIVSPNFLIKAQKETNYSTIDLLRGIYHDAKKFYSDSLLTQKLQRQSVNKEVNLENGCVS